MRTPATEVSMRPLIVMAALIWCPALAASPPLCTLPAPGAIPIADRLAEGPAQASPPSLPGQTPLAARLAEEPAKASPPSASVETPSPLPEALASMPFVQHVASAGAVVSDLGFSHGMRAI